MHPFEMTIGQLEFMSANLAHNLDFIPDDKLNWKPAPEANSVLEIVNHLAMPLSGMANALDGKWQVAFESAQDREEAFDAVGGHVAARVFLGTVRDGFVTADEVWSERLVQRRVIRHQSRSVVNALV